MPGLFVGSNRFRRGSRGTGSRLTGQSDLTPEQQFQAGQSALQRRFLGGQQRSQQAAAREQQFRGFAGSLIGEAGRERGLGETEEARAGFSRLVKQGGELSGQQVAEQSRRTTGQARAEIASQEGALANQFASRGITNPAAVAAAAAAGRGQTLGLGSRLQTEGERENARSLTGILGQASALGQARAGLQAATSFEQFEERAARSPGARRRREQEARNRRLMASFRSGGFRSRLA